MATLMEIDGIAVQIEWDPDEDRFYGVAEVPGGWVSIHGRDPDELRAAFRDTFKAQQEALTGGAVQGAAGRRRCSRVPGYVGSNPI